MSGGEGVLDGGWGYVWGAYGVTWAFLAAYGLSLMLRMRRARGGDE